MVAAGRFHGRHPPGRHAHDDMLIAVAGQVPTSTAKRVPIAATYSIVFHNYPFINGLRRGKYCRWSPPQVARPARAAKTGKETPCIARPPAKLAPDSPRPFLGLTPRSLPPAPCPLLPAPCSSARTLSVRCLEWTGGKIVGPKRRKGRVFPMKRRREKIRIC